MRLCHGEFFVELPLQPAVEINGIRMFSTKRATLGAGQMLQKARPAGPVAAVAFGQRAPGGEVVECAYLTLAEGGVSHLSAC